MAQNSREYRIQDSNRCRSRGFVQNAQLRHVTVLRSYLGDNVHEKLSQVFKGTRWVMHVSFQKGTTLSASDNISHCVWLLWKRRRIAFTQISPKTNLIVAEYLCVVHSLVTKMWETF
jgi:hypothetical protein